MATDDPCLDDEVIAALAAGDARARGALAHLETCPLCRELVSAARVRHTGGAGAADPAGTTDAAIETA
ncbi:MAG: hypothetical protein M3680_29900, partial [Myxococcota bacterium]|nr:hypothetical protein [Myxococcota bacterium]